MKHLRSGTLALMLLACGTPSLGAPFCLSTYEVFRDSRVNLSDLEGNFLALMAMLSRFDSLSPRLQLRALNLKADVINRLGGTGENIRNKFGGNAETQKDLLRNMAKTLGLSLNLEPTKNPHVQRLVEGASKLQNLLLSKKPIPARKIGFKPNLETTSLKEPPKEIGFMKTETKKPKLAELREPNQIKISFDDIAETVTIFDQSNHQTISAPYDHLAIMSTRYQGREYQVGQSNETGEFIVFRTDQKGIPGVIRIQQDRK